MALGPMAFGAALRRKYDILSKSADADMIRARAASGLKGAQSKEIITRTEQQGRPQDLLGLQNYLGMGLRSQAPMMTGGVPGGGQRPWGAYDTGSPAPRDDRTPTRTAPAGFGLASDDTPRRRVSDVFGSIFDSSRGLR